MKKLTLALAILSGTVFANDANFYSCVSTKDSARKASINFTPSDIVGQSDLSITVEVQDPESNKLVERTFSARGKQITVTKGTPIGTLYTYTDPNAARVGGSVSNYSIVLPDRVTIVALGAGPVKLASTLVITATAPTERKPNSATVTQTNLFLPLSCDAQVVQTLK